MRLQNKTVIVTGASSGIGAAASALFAREGARVVMGARRAERLEAQAAAIRAAGGEAEYLAGDVAEEGYAAALVRLAEETFGGLDAAFNNAGITGALGPIPEMDAETWAEVIDVNLTAGFYAAKHQVPALRARGGGS
ncbi:MAG: SDR family NAD(P)-dependent oxidoreductase, partial [Pseudomonadota bacterium]